MPEFAVLHKTDTGDYLRIASLDLTLRICKGGYTPRSGLYLAAHLSQRGIQGEVLDVGTGDTGLLAYCMAKLNAQRVVACDINPRTVECARTAGDGQAIEWLTSDMFAAIPKNYRFDLIVSNPPQLPMPIPGALHDYGGLDGRATILRLIGETRRFLKGNGSLVMLCFDFLGVDKRWSTTPSLKEIAADHGFALRIVTRHRKSVRPGGKTRSHLPWIQAVYPLYRFGKDEQGNPTHQIQVVEITKHK